MLAPEDEGDEPALNALRFSLASDIVELVVLSGDENFLQTLREAVGGSRRLWHVPGADKVSDLLIAGGVGILVVDAQTVQEPPEAFVTQITRQFPDLVVIVAGTRETEAALARLISDGTVYRFIHKPLSPGRARSFADAAVKKYDEQRQRSGAPRPRPRTRLPLRRGPLIGAAGGACLVLGTIWLLNHAAHEQRGGGAAPVGPSMPAAVSPPDATRPDAARPDAARPDAARSSPVNAEPLAERTESLLSAQLAKAREHRSDTRALAGQSAQFSALAMLRLQDGHWIEPERDNARYYIQEALHADPDADAALEAKQALALKLLGAARAAIEARDFGRAGDWLDAANDIAAPSNIDNLRALLAARQAGPGPGAVPQPIAGEPPAAPGPAAAPGPTAAPGPATPEPAAPGPALGAADLVLVKSVQPVYPARAQDSGVEGWVEVEFTVTETGAVSQLRVISASPAGLFDAAALAAVARWRYQPVLRAGRPAPQRARIRIRFALNHH